LIKDEFKTDSNVIKAASQSMVAGEKRWNNRFHRRQWRDFDERNYKFDSYFSNQTPKSILEADMGFIDAIGLKDIYHPRANGLVSMIKNIKMYAWHSNHKTKDYSYEKIVLSYY
jgi:cysteine desulfuration protein SufE